MKKEEKLSDEEKTAKLASRAFYKTKKTPKSQMIMIKILQANRLDPLRRAQKIASLAYFCKPDTNDLNIDYDIVEILFSVSSALKITEKTRFWINTHQHFDYFAIPWGFEITREKHEYFIEPWWKRNTVSCWHFKIPNLENFKIRKTTASCPYCHNILVDVPHISNEEMMNHVTKELREHIHFGKNMQISEEEYRRRKIMDDAYYVYYPPTLEANILVCPKCKKRILLHSKFYGGTQLNIYGYIKPPKITEKPLMFKSYDFLDENAVSVT